MRLLHHILPTSIIALLCLLTSATPLQAQEPAPLAGLPTTRLELVERAFEAIKAQDVDAYLALYLGFEDSVALCPGLYPGIEKIELLEKAYSERLEIRRQRLTDRLTECQAMIDFSSAEVLWREGGGWDDPISVCTLDVVQLDDLELYLRIGDSMFEVEIDDPAGLGDDLSFFVTDEPRCRESPRSMKRYLREEGVEPSATSPE